MTNLTTLFVYGTLRPIASGVMGADERARLAGEAHYLGPATTAGTLLDLGAYPGLAEGPGLVRGGLYALSEPAITFAWLDAYEGITGAARDEYRRCRRTVTQVDGTELVAWVYIFVRSADGIRAIASGDWLIG